MRVFIPAFALFLLASLSSFAQTYSVRGIITDPQAKTALPGANVLLIRQAADSARLGNIADVNGVFVVEKVRPGAYWMKVSFLGYKSVERRIVVENASLDVGQLLLEPDLTRLKEVEVLGKTPPVVQNGDTTQFNARAFKTNPDADAEDLLRKMPGIEVGAGTIKAQGEDVSKVLVDGKPFFGNDPNMALKNLPAEVIDQIQVYDQKSEQAIFSGIDDGQTTKTINIITRPDRRKGQFGRVYAGYGYDNKYQVGGNINSFNGNRRLSLIGQANNVNNQNFSAQDLVGISGSGGQGGGGRGGAGGGRSGGGGRQGGGGPGGNQGGAANNFIVGQQNGISTTNAIGLNYSDKWGSKMEVTGSYFFNNSKNTTNQSTFQEFIAAEQLGRTYQENSLSTRNNYNHRANLRIEYKIDSTNSLLMSPSLSFQRNKGVSSLFNQTKDNDSVISQSDVNNFSDLLGYNISNNLLFRHRFAKPRRTFSVSLNTSYDRYNGDNTLQSEAERYERDSLQITTRKQNSEIIRNGLNLSGNVSYTEPLSLKSLIQMEYALSWRQNDSEKETFDYSEQEEQYNLFNPGLSNTFVSEYTSQQFGARYRYQAQKATFSAGAKYQWARMQNDQVLPKAFELSRTFNNVLPTAMFRYQFSQKKNLNINYQTSTDQPSISQLQNVVNNNNPAQLSTGNPALSQSFQHGLAMRYSSTNVEKSSNFFALLSGNYTSDYITNTTLFAERDSILNGGVLWQRQTQLTLPVNVDGYWSVRSFLTYGLPISKIKSNLNFNASANYTRRPGLINDVLNYSNSRSAGMGLTLSSNISEKLDFTISSNSNYNLTTNTLQNSANTKYFTQSSRISLNVIFWKGLVYQTTLAHQLYSGLSQGYDQNYALWNMSIGKKLFKKQQGEVKVSVYDLLKQNNSIQRNIEANYIEDVQTNVLQRYFMLSFTYNIRKFKQS